MRIGVLVPALDRAPGAPSERPVGRAAQRLVADGIEVVFGHEARDGTLLGVVPQGDRYVPGGGVPDAIYDRFPSRSQPVAYAALRSALPSVPWANPPSLVDLCSDKLACQAVLEAHGLPLPPVESDPIRFEARLADWGAAFHKPRFGAYGRGIRLVEPGDALPAETEGAVLGEVEPAFLQRAVPPPDGFEGVSCRVLVQRRPDATWWVETPVARRDRTDPVVNAARGAEVLPLAEAVPAAVEPVRTLARQAAEALASEPDGAWLAEVGVDVVIDADEAPWLIEVNSRPRGRLEALAGIDPGQYAEAHVRACARPLRFLVEAAYGALRDPKETP